MTVIAQSDLSEKPAEPSKDVADKSLNVLQDAAHRL